MTDKPILTPFMEASGITLYQGDCINTMRRLPDNSVDAIITDPPYGLKFMGKDWDGFGTPLGFQTWTQAWASEARRILKPGAHLLAFAGTRTYHRMASGVEDAGFEIRDCIAWMYGSGFPKSLDVSKAIDRRKDWKALPMLQFKVREARIALGISQSEAARRCGLIPQGESLGGGGFMWFETGMRIPTREQYQRLKEALALDGECDEAFEEAEREVIAEREVPIGHAFASSTYQGDNTGTKDYADTLPHTPEAVAWNGWGTGLKPAHEPIVVARKPLIGTVAQNVLEHGTGALNIDACRISTTDSFGGGAKGSSGFADGYGNGDGWVSGSAAGRWPANVALDETAAALLDEQSGSLVSGANPTRRGTDNERATYGAFTGQAECEAPRGRDTGGASRFFYCAKASKKDRNTNGAANTHPTVKPTELMRWLIRLVTPPGGIILDPFGGSGSTGVAAQAENVRCILIEREDEYVQIIRDRLNDDQSLFSQLP